MWEKWCEVGDLVDEVLVVGLAEEDSIWWRERGERAKGAGKGLGRGGVEGLDVVVYEVRGER